MTPKEKAEELVDKYFIIIDNSHPLENILKTAKQCALTSVNEIIKALRKDLPEIGLGKGYWYNVKQEIEKL